MLYIYDVYTMHSLRLHVLIHRVLLNAEIILDTKSLYQYMIILRGIKLIPAVKIIAI